MLLHPTFFIPSLLVIVFWIFILTIAFRCYRALMGIEKSLAEIAATLRSKS
jgi:hypothetical protein